MRKWLQYGIAFEQDCFVLDPVLNKMVITDNIRLCSSKILSDYEEMKGMEPKVEACLKEIFNSQNPIDYPVISRNIKSQEAFMTNQILN